MLVLLKIPYTEVLNGKLKYPQTYLLNRLKSSTSMGMRYLESHFRMEKP